MFRLDVIERYIEVGMPGAKDSTRATRRSILRRIARHAHPLLSVAPGPAPIAYRRVRAPYAPHEVASYFRLAEAQPTAGRRDSLMAILVLGLGCGLDCADLGSVRGDDVSLTDDGVEVSVGGRRTRRVVCLSRYEDRLIALAASAAGRLLIGGAEQGRRNVTSVTLGRLLQDKSVPPLVVSRLRSTWLTAHLAANTPLPVIMRAAGLKTVRPLEDLLDHAPTVPVAEAARALRSAG
jgi:integrase